MPQAKPITPLQRFHLAWVALDTKTTKYFSHKQDQPSFIYGKVLRSMRTLAKRRLVKLTKEVNGGETYWHAMPTERGYAEIEKYKPEKPEWQLQLWDLKAPQLRTLCKFIKEHLGGKFEAKLQDWSYRSERKLFAKVSSFGQTRHGKRLVVWPKGGASCDAVLTVVGPDPDDRNEKAVNWIAEQMKVKLNPR